MFPYALHDKIIRMLSSCAINTAKYVKFMFLGDGFPMPVMVEL